MSADALDAAEQALRRAVSTNDLTLVEDLLAPDAEWHGAGPGGTCRSRDDVVATFRGRREEGIRPQLKAVRRIADRLLLELELSVEGGGRHWGLWFVLTLDAAGRIAVLRDHATAGSAEHDLAIWARSGAPSGRHDEDSAAPPDSVHELVPFVDVADVERSMRFYGLLGMVVQDTYAPDGTLVWASLASAGARLMVARSGREVEAAAQGVLLYLYVRDLAGLRDHLVAHGLQPSEIVDGAPGPREEMRVDDPDGYCLMVAQMDADTVVPADAVTGV